MRNELLETNIKTRRLCVLSNTKLTELYYIKFLPNLLIRWLCNISSWVYYKVNICRIYSLEIMFIKVP